MACNRSDFKKLNCGCYHCLTLEEKIIRYSSYMEDVLKHLKESITVEFEYCVEIVLDLVLEHTYMKDYCPFKKLRPNDSLLSPSKLSQIILEDMTGLQIHNEITIELAAPDHHIKCLRELESMFYENFIKRLEDYISCRMKKITPEEKKLDD